MLPAMNNGGGQCMIFPDVCKTPTPGGPVPIPYPNIAMLNQASGGTTAQKVKIKGKKAITTKTEITMSSGDEAGTAGGGVISNKFKGSAKFKKGSSTVKIEGNQAIRQTDMVGQNDASNPNCPAGITVGPSTAPDVTFGG
jgi:hypothetical protein